MDAQRNTLLKVLAEELLGNQEDDALGAIGGPAD